MFNFSGKYRSTVEESDFTQLRVEDLMHEHFVSFTPAMSIGDAAEIFSKYDNVLGGPVLDEAGKLIGYLSEHACLKQLADALINNQDVPPVGTIMYTEIAQLTAGTSIISALDQFLHNWFYAYPVVNDSGTCIGILPRKTIFRKLVQKSPTTW